MGTLCSQLADLPEAGRAQSVCMKRAEVDCQRMRAQFPWEKVKIAVEQLPRNTAIREAAATAVYEASNTPWTLTENFISCTDKDTQKMFLSISGAPLACSQACERQHL